MISEVTRKKGLIEMGCKSGRVQYGEEGITH